MALETTSALRTLLFKFPFLTTNLHSQKYLLAVSTRHLKFRFLISFTYSFLSFLLICLRVFFFPKMTVWFSLKLHITQYFSHDCQMVMGTTQCWCKTSGLNADSGSHKFNSQHFPPLPGVIPCC